ncbi:DNase I-like protein [Xylariaceae sp. FL0016]|nr:DNase I-like protein [Xylariaceae sp. FL0016]
MGIRITSWNVNGIRNPFSYQPWSEKRSFEAMFDILEADIVVMQETKIQRKDLQDDMVLVPGWDVYFSLPRHKKGYAGVAIYTRNSVCMPIRAEEGIMGVLTPPGSTTKFKDLPETQQIGGYPRPGQLVGTVDEATLDSEGRCVILEFPAFVLIGTYCPATRDESRDDFRLGYLDALDVRIRNLVAMGKRVVLTGDLNVIRDGIDTANITERLRKEGMTVEDFLSAPSRRLFNQLVFEGRAREPRDENREKPVLWDLGRLFNPARQGMFTCWETKKNMRPGNFGSRIDYVLCADAMKDWFADSNIQEGLMGSDHCPVFATLKETIVLDGKEVYTKDLMNPPGVFQDGIRLRDWTTKHLLPTSAKLIPEFDRRRTIKDMFFKRPATSKKAPSPSQDSVPNLSMESSDPTPTELITSTPPTVPQTESTKPTSPLAKRSPKTLKRNLSATASNNKPTKKSKSTLVKESSSKGQSSLMGFLKPKTTDSLSQDSEPAESTPTGLDGNVDLDPVPEPAENGATSGSPLRTGHDTNTFNSDTVFDPIQNKESWSKLLRKRAVPKCEHGDDCISLTTKKPGVNRGRLFYICPRPIGPSGEKEKGTQWRCGTFIWSSDWSGSQPT